MTGISSGPFCPCSRPDPGQTIASITTSGPRASRTFERLQWIQGTGAAAALSQMAVRFGTDDDRLAALARERQDRVNQWKAQDRALIKAIGAADKRDVEQEKSLRDSLKVVETRITEIDAILSKDFPDYAALANPKPLEAQDAQAQLQEDEALVYIADTPEWKKTPGETFIWVVTKTDMKWNRSELGTEALSTMVRSLRCGLDAVSWRDDKNFADACNKLLKITYNWQDYKKGTPLPFDTEIAAKLYDALFGQAKDMLRGKKLLLVLSGPLTALPLQALITEQPAGRFWDRNIALSLIKWMIHDHDLTVLPSVASLRDLRRTSKPGKAREPFFGMGNPLLTGNSGLDNRAWEKQACAFELEKAPLKVAGWTVPESLARLFRGGKVDLDLLKRQDPLPESADELCAVAKALGASEAAVHLGANATEAHLKKLSEDDVLKNARVLHFATHGLLAGETGEVLKLRAEPALILTPPDIASDLDDGLLTASEVTRLELDADLVILSACNTAAGDKPGAEALSGLAKAFFYARARALLVSHWAVSSKATVELITRSLNALAKDKTLGQAGALRTAMREMIGSNTYSHPAYWAPFVVVGEGSYLAQK